MRGSQDTPSRTYPWWSMLLGRHDHNIIFLHYVSGGIRQTDVTTVIGDEACMPPRFWVLTDCSQRQIVLVFRSTMTLNEVTVYLT